MPPAAHRSGSRPAPWATAAAASGVEQRTGVFAAFATRTPSAKNARSAQQARVAARRPAVAGAPGQVVEQPGTFDAGQATVASIHPTRQPFQVAAIAVQGGAGQAVLGPDRIEEALDAHTRRRAARAVAGPAGGVRRGGNKGHACRIRGPLRARPALRLLGACPPAHRHGPCGATRNSVRARCPGACWRWSTTLPVLALWMLAGTLFTLAYTLATRSARTSHRSAPGSGCCGRVCWAIRGCHGQLAPWRTDAGHAAVAAESSRAMARRCGAASCGCASRWGRCRCCWAAWDSGGPGSTANA